jgi:hypothetical protein
MTCKETDVSVLPETYEEETIEKMLPGEVGYTVPWAMWADANRVLWLNGHYGITARPHGTSHLRVERTKAGAIVYQETIHDHRYSVGASSWDGVPWALPVELR